MSVNSRGSSADVVFQQNQQVHKNIILTNAGLNRTRT